MRLGGAIGLVLLATGASSVSAQPPAVPVVAGLTATGVVPEAPPPKMADPVPNLSAEQTAALICDALTSNQIAVRDAYDRHRALHDATVAARQSRREAALGAVADGRLETAELGRQAAYRAIYPRSTDWKAENQLARRHPAIAVEDLTFAFARRDGLRTLTLKGTLRNTTTRKTDIPPLTYWVTDQNGLGVRARTRMHAKASIGPGETQPFEIVDVNAPEYGQAAGAYLGPPYRLDSYRGCLFFDPATFDPRQSADALVATGQPLFTDVSAKVGIDRRTPYSPNEIARLELFFRRQGQGILGRNLPGIHGCGPGLLGDWRESFVRAELFDEVFWKTRRLAHVRRQAEAGVMEAAEVQTAEAELQERLGALEAFRSFGFSQEKAFAIENERLNLSKGRPYAARNDQERRGIESSTPESRAPLYDVRVTGEFTSRSRDQRPAAPVAVVIRDRRGMVLETMMFGSRNVVPPGLRIPFTFNFWLAPASVASATTNVPGDLVGAIEVGIGPDDCPTASDLPRR